MSATCISPLANYPHQCHNGAIAGATAWPHIDSLSDNRIVRGIKNLLHLYRTNWSYKIEKTVKIAFRAIDLVGIYNGPLRASYKLLSSTLKDTALAIESTNFFFVSYPLFSQGKAFFQTRTKVQSAETVSLTAHLFLKMFVGAERAGLLKLGIIGSYAIGHVPLFKYALEGLVFMFNFFGIWDGTSKLSTAKERLALSQRKIAKWEARQHALPISPLAAPDSGKWTAAKIESKQRKWKLVHYNKEIDQTKAWFKIAAKVSKLILIAFAVTLATINVMTINCLVAILNLGIISDAIGLAGFFYSERCAANPLPAWAKPAL